VLGQQSGERRATCQAAKAFPQRAINAEPSFVRACNSPGLLNRPVTGFLPVRVSPSQNLLDSQRWQILHVSDAAVFRQQFRQRRDTRKATAPSPQSTIDSEPGLFGARHWSGIHFRPVTGLLLVYVRPSQNLFDGYWRKIVHISDPAVLGQKLGQRRNTWNATAPSPQSTIDSE